MDHQRETIIAALRRAGLGLAGDRFELRPLDGGVSSDVWKATVGDQRFCIKSALARLKTKAEWTAPIGRSEAEWNWLSWVGTRFPDLVPRCHFFDPAGPALVMEYLPPDRYPNWKRELFAGRISNGFAEMLGARLAEIHSASAGDEEIARTFSNDADFGALRIEPYFRYTAMREPGVAARLNALADEQALACIALVHGDVSPKNILCGPVGPVFIDAECANFGDPAFDVAFCLHHLFIKALVIPGAKPALLEAAISLSRAYFAKVDWEDAAAIASRAAALVPALMLARVSGKSPAEYLDRDLGQTVRGAALALLAAPLADIHPIGQFLAGYSHEPG